MARHSFISSVVQTLVLVPTPTPIRAQIRTLAQTPAPLVHRALALGPLLAGRADVTPATNEEMRETPDEERIEITLETREAHQVLDEAPVLRCERHESREQIETNRPCRASMSLYTLNTPTQEDAQQREIQKKSSLPSEQLIPYFRNPPPHNTDSPQILGGRPPSVVLVHIVCC